MPWHSIISWAELRLKHSTVLRKLKNKLCGNWKSRQVTGQVYRFASCWPFFIHNTSLLDSELSYKLGNSISQFHQDGLVPVPAVQAQLEIVATFSLKRVPVWMINYGVTPHISFQTVIYNITYSDNHCL